MVPAPRERGDHPRVLPLPARSVLPTTSALSEVPSGVGEGRPLVARPGARTQGRQRAAPDGRPGWRERGRAGSIRSRAAARSIGARPARKGTVSMDRGVDVSVGMRSETARRPQEGEGVELASVEETSAGEASAGEASAAIRMWRLAAGVTALYLGIRALGLLLLNTMIYHGGARPSVHNPGAIGALRDWGARFFLPPAGPRLAQPAVAGPHGGPGVRSAALP